MAFFGAYFGGTVITVSAPAPTSPDPVPGPTPATVLTVATVDMVAGAIDRLAEQYRDKDD